MKSLGKLFFTLLLFCPVLSSGQIKFTNGDFETWNNYNGYNYPDNWYVDDTLSVENSIITRSTDAASGTYSLRFNSVSGGGMQIPYIETGDTLDDLDKPNQIEFWVKVDNIGNMLFDGAEVLIYMYDTNYDYVTEKRITINNNVKTWSKVTNSVNFSGIKYFHMELTMYNLSGSSNMYVMLDGIKLTKEAVSTGDPVQVVIPSIGPNPVVDHINLHNTGDVRQVSITSMDGKDEKQIRMDGTNDRQIDIRDLKAGLYFIRLEMLNGDLYTEKFVKL